MKYVLCLTIFVCSLCQLSAQSLDRWQQRESVAEFYGNTFFGTGDAPITISVVHIDKKDWHTWRDNIYVTNRTDHHVVFQVIFRIARASALSSKNKLGSKKSEWFKVTGVIPAHTVNQPFLSGEELPYEWWSKLGRKSGLQWGIDLFDYQCTRLEYL